MRAYEKFAAGLILGTSLAAQALAESKYSPWGSPVNLGCVVNSASADIGPGISKDGLSLYFGSSRADPGASGDFDLYIAQRPSRDAPWGPALNLGTLNPGKGINSPAADAVVSFSRDGHWMAFNSNRAGGFGSVDIWASFREHVHDDSAWGPPSNLGSGVNSAGFDGGASYFENEEGSAPLLFFNRRLSGDPPVNDIHVSELQPDGTFGNASPVPELNSPQEDQRPSIRFDGLEIFFFSNRRGSMEVAPEIPSFDIWVATRNSPNDVWAEPVNLGSVVNTGGAEQMPYISPDASTLYFASDRPGGCGGLDLYMTTRTKRGDGDKAN